ncbi:hypothetical protein Tco_0961991 [Tanacetum coccineum]
MALSPPSFCNRYRSSYKTPFSSPSPSLSPTLPIQKRYRGTSEPILDTETEDDESEAKGAGSRSEESKDEDPGSEGEEAASEEQKADKTPKIPTRPTWVDPKDGTVYIDIELDAPPDRAPVQTLASPEWSSSSLPISPASLTIPSHVASPVTTPSATIILDEDEFIEVGAQLELHGSILHDHTQRLNALPPTLLEGMGWDITKLNDRSAVVRGKIHSQRFRLGSLEREQEQATITFGALWQPVLALEAWAGWTDAQRADLWQARYEDQRKIHALRMHHAAD